MALHFYLINILGNMPAFSHLKWSPIGGANYFQIQSKVLPICSWSKFSCLPPLPGRSSSKPILDKRAISNRLISSFHIPSLPLWPLVALACWSLGFPCAPVGCSQLSSRNLWERDSHTQSFGCTPEELTFVFVQSTLILTVFFHSAWKWVLRLLQNK